MSKRIKTDEAAKSGEAQDKKNWLEWTVFNVSFLLVLGIIAYLGYQVYAHKPTSPDLRVSSFQDPSSNAPYRYRVVVYNDGGTTAEEVMVELALEKAGHVLEKAELHLPFAPQESKREAWVSFRVNPQRADTLAARVVSYKKP